MTDMEMPPETGGKTQKDFVLVSNYQDITEED